MIEWETVEQWVRDWLDSINYTFYNAVKALTVSPFDSSIRVIDTAMSAIEGVALVLVTMFFFIELCNEAMLLKIQSYEQVFKLVFKFVMAKVIVENARGIMGIIYNGFNSIA
ncbi:MAG: hypothetical protein IK990_13990, partial [Ruminiclostridium sp.]|nr:hypothetical protein [Ruminiclostridium sp.]